MTPNRYSPEGVLSTLLLIALSLVIFLQIAGRLGLFPGQVWTEELIRWLWVWMAWCHRFGARRCAARSTA